jgi:hypothetical protein
MTEMSVGSVYHLEHEMIRQTPQMKGKEIDFILLFVFCVSVYRSICVSIIVFYCIPDHM